MVAEPETARVVTEFEDIMEKEINMESSHRHHEQTPSVQTFAKYVNSLVSTVEDMGNLFLKESGDLIVLDTKASLGAAMVQSVYSTEDLGLQQYNARVTSRFRQNPARPVSDTVKKNNCLSLASQHPKCSQEINTS